MPYTEVKELPDAVKHHLPHHAQEIFLAAFNHAFDEYEGEEERAFRVAWAAVKRDYEKGDDGNWHRKPD
ncbi:MULTISPECIES: ChaB family protein [Trichocoleus]|uniref:ChaB family protein n=1 Tax=Trichocoleus desertorum GB2-A4 TaxID=2933944 RepID=A0ABV0J994_9CYAN|nr:MULTISPECIES: ChaB family protein [unclassified Trichocoleus]MBD1864731.1 ChaB family protein [Trichocoleus sp. FACHB-46]MBD2120372.1 ChaB family protein [Trichocoleus sp. FACHB-262]